MIRVKVKIDGLFRRFPQLATPAAKSEMMSSAVYALRVQIQRHLVKVAPRKHASASRLGAARTGHIEKGAAAITAESNAQGGTVRIPIPGLARARRPVAILPVIAKALTIPLASESYGRRVAEMKRMGWTIFRPKGKNVLMGSLTGSDAKALYALRKGVTLREDRELLPTDADMSAEVKRAMIAYVRNKLGRSA